MPNDAKTRKPSDLGVALLAAIAVFFVSFFIFNVVYIRWAVHTYPHNNSMAGLAAFVYGFPVAGAFALFTFVFVLFWRRKRNRPT